MLLIEQLSGYYTIDDEGVSRRHTSDGETLLLFGFNIRSHILHTTVLVPLYVPHDGHFFTPLLVDLPKSDSSALILFECAIKYYWCENKKCTAFAIQNTMIFNVNTILVPQVK